MSLDLCPPATRSFVDRVGRCLLPLALVALGLSADASGATPAARERLTHRLGPQAVFEVDARTGTPRVVARTDGTLTGPSHADAERVARDYVRANLGAFGLTGKDLDGLRLADRQTTTGGIEILRFRQYVDGVPALDSELKVALTRDGRVLTVLGAPESGLTAPTTPRISAPQAMEAVSGHAGARVVSASPGPRR